MPADGQQRTFQGRIQYYDADTGGWVDMPGAGGATNTGPDPNIAKYADYWIAFGIDPSTPQGRIVLNNLNNPPQDKSGNLVSADAIFNEWANAFNTGPYAPRETASSGAAEAAATGRTEIEQAGATQRETMSEAATAAEGEKNRQAAQILENLRAENAAKAAKISEAGAL